MTLDRLKQTVGPLAWQAFNRMLGEPEEMLALRQELSHGQATLRQAEQTWATEKARLENEIEITRNERLSWQGKEASTRKDLQDCQNRSKELLEQVVRLTHQQRDAKKNLLDEQFRTSTMPLERNRHEMEMTQARGDVRRADEKVKMAESKLAECVKHRKGLERKASRIKGLESDLDWSRQRVAEHLQALGAAITRIRNLELQIKKSYDKPDIHRASKAQQAAYQQV